MARRAKTGFDKFFGQQMVSPSFANAYATSRTEIDAADERGRATTRQAGSRLLAEKTGEQEGAGRTVEMEFVAAFVLPARRERLAFELQSRAKRSRFFQKLSGRYFEYLDERLASAIALGDPVSIGKMLRRKGAPENCHVMSGVLLDLDGRDVPLFEALSGVVGSGMPSIVICRPSQLAYFEAEQERGAPPRYVLERRH